MNRENLTREIRKKGSFLCVGLDTDIEKIPAHLKGFPDPVFECNRQIIEATADLCVAYKINTAFYESRGVSGWRSLEKTVNYIPSSHFKIADAKRGDIGNTSRQYAKTFFETYPFDSITVAPYMGSDSIKPFIDYPDKWTIILGLTSNPGSADFQKQRLHDGFLYEKVIQTTAEWGTPDNLMYVIGATNASDLVSIRKLIPHHFLLIPGVGFQGGNLSEVASNGMNEEVGLLVNVSRSIIYAGNGPNFADEARKIATQYQSEMKSYL